MNYQASYLKFCEYYNHTRRVPEKRVFQIKQNYFEI